MRYLFFALPLLLACAGIHAQTTQPAAAPTATAAKTSNLAGKVELLEGGVTVYDKSKKARPIGVGDPIYEGDGIVTGKDGELHLDMEDGGFIAVRPNTKMRITAYQAQGQDDDKGVFSLLQGAFRSVTGWIGKYNPKAYQVRTPTATIGVRGTDHEPLVIPEGSAEGEPGTYDKVNIGGSFIETRHGRVDVAPNQAAFAPWRGGPVPRVLPQVPHFFKATRNEHRLASRHEAIHKVIEQRRDERRKVFEQRRKELRERKSGAAERRIDRRQQFQEHRRPQELQRHEQREERRKPWQERRDRPQPDAALRQGGEPERRAQFAEERRQRLEQRRGKAENAKGRGDGPPSGEARRERRKRPAAEESQNGPERNHGPRGARAAGLSVRAGAGAASTTLPPRDPPALNARRASG